ncbi:unnamed protein product, partial [Brenthis ino]
MTSELKFKELITKRSSIKGRVTKFKIYLESLVALESISAVEVNKLAMKLSRMEALFIEFDGLQSQIEVHSEANQSAELSTRDFIEQEFDNCIAIAQDLIQSNSSAPKQVEVESRVASTCNFPSSVVMSALSSSDILLCIAKVRLTNPNTNETICARALLDSGSQSSFITESVKQRLNLTPQPSNVNIVAIGNNTLNLSPERCSLKLQSNTSSFEVSMFCLVLKTISDDLPKHHFNISSLKLNNLELADPSFNEPSPIDMLIGSDLFWDLIGSEQRSLGLNNPNLHSSKLGWLIAGPAPIQMQPPPKRFLTCNFLQRKDKLEDIQEDLSKFWELENVPKSQPLSEEQRLCEKLFISDTRRESDGRFCVGASTAEELRRIQRAVSRELAKGCFPLRKYRSNLPNVLEADPNNNENLIISNATSTLELCGAFLGAELSSAVIKALRIELKRCVFWTDSCVVLGWLRSPDKTKTFVANRVAAIGELTDPKAWRYVPTSENPADLASRGVDPQEVNDSTIWWHGPMFLMQPESSWPILSAGNEVNLPELKAMHALVVEDVPAGREDVGATSAPRNATQPQPSRYWLPAVNAIGTTRGMTR